MRKWYKITVLKEQAMIVKKYDTVENEAVNVEGASNTSIRWLIGKDSEAPNFYLRQLELEPGGHTPFHAHQWEHEVYVLEGSGQINSEDNQSTPLEKGTFALVMPGEKHSFRNTGDTTFKFLCIIPKTGS
jgi:quercetin dioxygenase-like cupin family protein